MEKKKWYLYIAECSDKTLYTGITIDLDKRIQEHNDGSASKYTRSRRPVKCVYSTGFPDRASVSSVEYLVKRLSRRQKIKLIEGDPQVLKRVASGKQSGY